VFDRRELNIGRPCGLPILFLVDFVYYHSNSCPFIIDDSMTTKAPSPVHAAPEQSIEKIAYESVKNIPTVDPHDQDRLGFNVWRWLTLRNDPLEIAVKSAGAHFLIPEEEAVETIRQNLKQFGVTL
jgi:hypothetical protein